MSATGGRNAAKITIERLHNIILEKIKAEVTLQKLVNPVPCFSASEIVEHCPKVNKDISKIVFDFENETTDPKSPFGGQSQIGKCLNGYQTLDNGFTFLGVQAGGDWEGPLFFIVYYDGKDLRGYIPEDGNVYNKLTKTAFGSEGENDKVSYTEADMKKIATMFPGINKDEITKAIDECGDDFDNLNQYICEWSSTIDFDWNKIEKDIKNRILVI